MTRYRIADGLHLNLECDGSGPPIVLLHGFMGSGRAWGDFRSRLARRFTTVAVDLVGHGRSDSPEDVRCYRMSRVRRDVVELVSQAGFERADWLGYSMGGRTALHVAWALPSAVRRLVLIGSAPGIADEAERAARVESDNALADDIERDGVEAFVDRWEQLPLFATQRRLPAAVRREIRAGRLASSRKGLAGSLRGMGAGAQEPLHDRLPSIAIPTLLLAGGEDSKYTALGREMAARMPAAEFVSIPGVGHAAHTEDPEFCARSVVRFLDEGETS